MRTRNRLAVFAVFAGLLPLLAARGQDYRPADQEQKPARSNIVLPEKFLRGYDPVTVYFSSNRGPGRGPADKGERLLSIQPEWPGAWSWIDRRTLQFRPAEPWPALARFRVKASGASRILTTVMSAPTSMSPPAGSTDLKPFRSIQLTFAQALPLASLKKMVRLELRDLPGLADSPRRPIEDFSIALLPRRSMRDPARYAITLGEEIPEGKQLHVHIALALGDEDEVLWSGRASTRPPFHLASVECGGARLDLRGSAEMPKELALACGHSGETPQLRFSAPVAGLTLTQLKKLVHMDPAVSGLHFETYGHRVVLRGKFVPDVLYRMSLRDAPVHDDSGRRLEDPGRVEAFFYLGWKQPFLRWKQATAILEANGPRMIPVIGYGEPRVDMRIYRIDPLHKGLWPFPGSPVLVHEESPPPFPGEEPEDPTGQPRFVGSGELQQHLRLLGSPLVSRIVDLPLGKHGSTTHFGLDIGPYVDQALGKGRPGHYLVGIRRLTGDPQRAYVRVQVTNLSLTSVEERDKVVFYVRRIDDAEPVSDATIIIEVIRDPPPPRPGKPRKPPYVDTISLRTDGDGRAVLHPQKQWNSVHRVYVKKGEDVLLINPSDPPPRFANNHWSSWGNWLHWISRDIPAPANDRLVGFVFTERAIYRPGEKVFIKGYVRRKISGRLTDPGSESSYALKIRAPGGKEWIRPVRFTALKGFDAVFDEKDAPTGHYTVSLLQRKPTQQTIASRSFKIEAYRIPKFEVQMVGPDRVPNDRPFSIKAMARYYAGGSVASRPVEWVVTRRPYHHLPKGRKGYLFASSLQFSRDGQARPPDTVREERTLSPKGADEFEIRPQLDMDGSARVYRAEATVTGVDNQLVAAVHETKALPPFVLGMKLDRYFEKPAALKPEIIAVGVDDKLVAGQKITVRLFRRTWHSHLRETDFSTGKADYVTEQHDEKLLETELASDAKRAVRPSLPLDKSGVYLVELVARDSLGRVQTLSADLYVGGKDAVAWKKPSQGIFELSLDKKKYKPGETAQLILQSPFQEGKGLVIVEHPGGNEHHWVEIRGGKAVQPIHIGTQHVPNLPVHAVILRGRLGQGGDDARHRPRTLAASKDIEVEPTSMLAKISVSHPKTVRPGSTVKMEIRLRDDRDRPLPGEVTLWLVDEAVLALTHEESLDPLKTLVVRNGRSTSVRDTRNRVVGRLAEQEEPAGDGGEEAAERLKGKRRVRKNFQTVPYYQATLKVGPSGRLTVSIQVSDDLTNFQVRAVAVSGMERFGTCHQRLRVRLPVIVQPMLPRFVRQGDRFMAGGVGRLVEGKEGPGKVAIQVDGPIQTRLYSDKTMLRKTVPGVHLIPIEVPSGDPADAVPLRVRMEIERLSDGVGDAFEVKLPVLPDRQLAHLAWFQRLGEGSHKLKPFPEAPRPGTASQEVLVSTVPGVMELLAGLDYLAAYPHGCFEQRMSQLLPQMQIGAVLKRLGLNEHYALQVAEHMEQLLRDVGLFQDDRGFFAYWPGGKGDVHLTAQAVEFLAMARRYEYAVDEKLFSRGVQALKRVLRSDFTGFAAGYRFNQQTSAMRALTFVGELDENYLIDMYHHVDDMDLTSVADMALSMHTRPKVFRTNLPELKRYMWDKVVFKLYRGKPVYEGLRWYRRSWTEDYLGSQTSTLAAVFEALLRLDPKNERIELLRDALLSRAAASVGFGNTHDNRRAIAALLAYMEAATFAGFDAQVQIAADGQLELDEKTKLARKRFRSDRPTELLVRAERELGARIQYTYLPAAPGDRVEPLGQGFILSRRTTIIPAGGGPETHFEDEPGKKVELGMGDVLEIEARLVSDKPHHHVAVIVPFAAGLEPLNPELKTAGAIARPSRSDTIRASYTQRIDSEMRYYFTHLPRGTHAFYFRLRASTAGSFVHPAPWAEQMYHQEVRGRGAGMRVEVKAGSAH
ncbi:MAG: hypothetical protein JXR96_28270 [Deltaproteobacteria bacterium]|nr:hypothetical protein [Deltaproteobacteria bacterium]